MEKLISKCKISKERLAAFINKSDAQGFSAMNYALREDKTDMIAILLKAGATEVSPRLRSNSKSLFSESMKLGKNVDPESETTIKQSPSV